MRESRRRHLAEDLFQVFGDEDGRLETTPNDAESQSQLGIAGLRQMGGREETAEVIEDGLNPSGRMIFEKSPVVESEDVADDQVDVLRGSGN